ncbi:MAG: Rieske 2Fe-2S domain-containing protein [Candidatus Bipolaricaulota bacterium]|nr:Rieske 2Fe-2S domain-containing protein [Candidatus Bipolaricaulota bacterium]MDW8031179.1 Rieske 2Fe-2S domain-containing protein [Candidatus Bipolaricaulota bacterium]
MEAERDSTIELPIGSLTRRRFLGWLGWGSLALALGGIAQGIPFYLKPRLTYEPTTTFIVGRPSDYQVGEMRPIEAKRVLIFRTPLGFQALSMTCTHLGCSYKPFGPPTREYPVVHAVCPCHGSVFARDGRVLGGPAPKPLPFYRLSLTPDGRLQVDNAQTVPSTWYLTVEGQEIEGPTPDGSDIKFS